MEKSAVKKEDTQLKWDLPAAVQALGLIKFDGTGQNPLERIKRENGYLIIDDKYCYTKKLTPLSLKELWIRVPRYFPSLRTEEINRLPHCYQICDTQAVLGKHYNAFVKDNEIFELSLIPIPRRLVLNDIELLSVEAAEVALQNNNLAQAEETLSRLLKSCPDNPRIQFAYGALLLRLGYYEKAKYHFQKAAFWGHPDGKDAADTAEKLFLQNVRFKYQSLFNNLDNKNYGAALNDITNFIHDAPICGNSIKAYLLNELNLKEECIRACRETLNCDLMQNKILALLWKNLIASEQDKEADLINKLHLELFPYDKQAYINALDTALISGEAEEAEKILQAYLTIETDYDQILHNLNKFYDNIRNWTKLMNFYEIILPLMSNKNLKTVIEYCETLIELNKNYEANTLLQRLLSHNPDSVEALLAYSRGLARSGDIKAAENLLRSVLHQDIGNEREKLLMTAFLSELLRTNGKELEAFSLWQELNPSLEMLKIAGTRPLIEYIYCLNTQEKRAKALFLSNMLSGLEPNDYLVKELHKNLEIK